MPARVNLFSPLPPLKSDVGNHTLLVARALSEHAEVTLWTPQAEPPDVALEVPVVRFDPAAVDWPRLNRGSVNVYNIGNNATFHRAIFDVARQAPGVIVLHDTRLQHFFARYSETPGAGRAFYRESLRRCHGTAALADADRWLAGEEPLDHLVLRYPMTAAAIDGALAVIVHNPAERRSVAEQTRVPVFHLPLAFRAGPTPVRATVGRRLRVIMFGFLGSNRRIGAVLEVLAALPDQEVDLTIYGVLEEPAAVYAHVAALGLGDRVKCFGYVAEQELQTALLRADLAINLRFPSMGEASGSQLRIWSAALPSIVSRVGWYATLSDDAVSFAGPEEEGAMLAQHLTAFRQDPAPYQAAGLRGRAIVEQHHAPALYARGLLDILGQLPALHARRTAGELSRVAAHGLMESCGIGGVMLCADQVSEAVAGLAPSLRISGRQAAQPL